MSKRLEVLLAGRSKETVDSIASELRHYGGYRLVTRHIENGHTDPLYGVARVPDVVVMLVAGAGHSDLAALAGEQRPAGGSPMIVVAEQGDAESMRLAMRAGARDFLTGRIEAADLAETIDRLGAHFADRASEEGQNLTVFVNAKGGSGATFLACNTAHILNAVSQRSTALLSLDLQFDTLPQYFDTPLRHGLMDVLDSADSLDDVALDAYMTQHESGLRMLAAQPEDLIESQHQRAAPLGTLLDKILTCYDHVVVDVPRRIDPYFVCVLEKASRVVLVVQQTIGHLRDAARMLQIFETHGVAPNQVLVVVNRYDKSSSITIEDVKRALPETEISLVPSDFKTVAESINLGQPMHEHARGSAVTKALLALETKIGGEAAEISKSFIGKAVASILRKDKWSRA
jgi:pilus assembly protein CpaE